jgi:RNA polymerase sigma-70 factor (ECF subfamily)
MATGSDLIGAMGAGDREAFSLFYDRYAPLVYSLILKIVREPSEAADVLQEVFWESWQTARTYDARRGSPEAWIVIRARSRAIDRIRSMRRRAVTFGMPLDEAATAARPDAGDDPAARAEERGVIRDALAQLPEAQREVIELAYYGGLTQTEIADRLEQPLGTVKTRIRTGLERLRTLIKAPSSFPGAASAGMDRTGPRP